MDEQYKGKCDIKPVYFIMSLKLKLKGGCENW